MGVNLFDINRTISDKKWIIFLILSTLLQWPLLVDSVVSFLPNLKSSNFWEDAGNITYSRPRRQLPVNTCPSDMQNCYDGTCINPELICDGAVNCPDGSDETQARCQRIKCPSYLFRCSYGACVAKKAKCNGKQDCADNSDELHRDCVKTPTVANSCNGDFQCNNGKCIPIEDTCDGRADCSDRSDETVTLCSARTCPKFSFRCAYGACVSKNAKCNNKVDCVDGSDEEPTLCGKAPSQTTKKPTTTTTTTTAGPVVAGDGQCLLPEFPNRGRYMVENSNIAAVPGTPVPAYAFLNYSCPNGYKVYPNFPVFCQEDGTWSANADCLKQCTMPVSYTVDFICYKNMAESIPCGDKVPFGTVVYFKCKQNHFLPGRNVSLTCTDSGSFDKPTPRCRAECGYEVSMGQKFAINASDAKRGTFPWQVALYQGDPAVGNWEHICGGSLIATHLIISAAHCVYSSRTEKALPASQFSVAVGKLYRSWNNQEDDNENYVQKSQVKSIHIPGQYGGDQQNQQSDIAILEVDTIFKFYDSVRPICLDLSNEEFNRIQVAHNTFGKVAGWGLTKEDGKPSEILQTLSMPVIDYHVCKEEFDKYQFRRYLTSDKLCAGYLNGSSLCQGDSGGGLVMPTKSIDNQERWYLRGVVSVGPRNEKKSSCRHDTYTAFTEVYKLRDFLTEKFDDLNFILN